MKPTDIIPAWGELKITQSTKNLVEMLCENSERAEQYITDNANYWSLETLVDALISPDCDMEEEEREEETGEPAEFHAVHRENSIEICRERADGLPDCNNYYRIHTGVYWKGNEAVDEDTGDIIGSAY